MNKLAGNLILVLILLRGIETAAQNSPNLEFASAQGTSNPTGNGPVTNTIINFVQNPNNPSGNTFQTYTPTLSVTFAISNQMYNNAGRIGYANLNVSAPIFPLMNSAGSPANNNFTASGASTGTGINTASNRGVGLFFNTAALNGRPTNATYQMADLTITFSRPVDDPILHIGGMGGFQNNLGLTGGFDYVSSNVPISFSRLSGNSNSFTVTSTSIKNTAANPTSTGNNSASGSVLVTGKGITTIVLRMTARGDGNDTSWTTQSGDVVTMGISTLESDLAVTKSINNPNPERQSIVAFTINAINNGPSHNTNVVVSDLLPNGYTFIGSSTNSGVYNSSTGNWTIGNMNAGITASLTVTAKVNCTGDYTNIATISGNLSDHISGNNSSSVTPAVNPKPCACYNDPNRSSIGADSKFGITLLKRAGANSDNWPMARKSAHLVLESNDKGFVITRMTSDQVSSIMVPVEGMMVYDTTQKCLKLYSDNSWNCFTTPTCP
ncbi:conserved repeat domain [Chryseobacterium nakagawai]|uniref:DUF11 domain-containing protein n=1 Tax=Chryseobacterium nakagawai TaxID=1241982 RepID=A0AAD0YR32_CHRNA|nr:DUF11 domain-containing protein [Chryseobacterium nakagawai]AZA93615.1 DUF11 domain-containing protein [Chryseobacterium nakagawai]VEH20315.1 conserved repeat domain [Chryseobacterium nakagawai]